MDKREFLEKLALALAGQVPRSVIEENISYYDSYISFSSWISHAYNMATSSNRISKIIFLS